MVVAMAISVDSEILSESCKGFQWRYDAMAMLLCTSEEGVRGFLAIRNIGRRESVTNFELG